MMIIRCEPEPDTCEYQCQVLATGRVKALSDGYHYADCIFDTAGCQPASCRVIGRVLSPWGPSVTSYEIIHCTPKLNQMGKS